MITRQFNATHLFIMTGLQSHFIVNDFKIGCICSTNFASFPHQLSKILCTLFSSTKLSVLRTIEKHCTAAIWLLRPKIWTHFQTITSHFPDRDYYCTENQIGFHFNTLYSHVMFDCNDRFIFQYLYLSNRRPFCILDGNDNNESFPLCSCHHVSPPF